MAWTYLIVSGFLECVWAIGLKYSQGFSKLWPSVLTILAMVVSMGLLALAVRELPVGTAYAVWVGIGAFGTAVFGIILLGESAELPRLACLFGLALSIIGLKLTG